MVPVHLLYLQYLTKILDTKNHRGNIFNFIFFVFFFVLRILVPEDIHRFTSPTAPGLVTLEKFYARHPRGTFLSLSLSLSLSCTFSLTLLASRFYFSHANLFNFFLLKFFLFFLPSSAIPFVGR